MAPIFLKILNMSISASWIVLAVVLLRLIIKKAPKWISCLLWAIVGLRLIMPFSLESVFSLIPSAETISKPTDSPRPIIDTGLPVVDSGVNEYLQSSYYEGVTRPVGNFIDITAILGIIWAVGVAALLVYAVVSYLRLKRKISTAVLLHDNIYQSERIASPFLFGIVKPRIYLPFDICEGDMQHVISHEQAHIKRKDHWWKPLGFLLLAVYWFNPFMWLGYILLCRDIELACDERVVKGFDTQNKADYSQALLACSVNRRVIAACPLAFGEVGVKSRVKSVLSYKKPTIWIIAVALIVSIVCAVCFLTDPAKKTNGSTSDTSSSAVTSDTPSDTSSEEEYLLGGTTSILYTSEVSSRMPSYPPSTSATSKIIIAPTMGIHTVGKISDKGVFTNDFVGIGFNFDSSWDYLTASDISSLNKGKSSSSQFMYCAQGAKDDGTTLVVTLDYPRAVYGSKKTAEQYSIAIRKDIIENLKILGATNISYYDTQQMFLGASCYIVYINYHYKGKLNKEAVAFIPRDNHIATISVNTVDGSNPNDVLSLFYSVELNKTAWRDDVFLGFAY